MAQVSPFWPVNLCKCGHDYQAHTGAALPTGTCTLCTTATGPHVHGFTSTNEIDPSVQFRETLPARFVTSGALGTYGPATTTTGVANTAGATVVTVTSTVGAVNGGVIRLSPAAAIQDQESYTILKVLSATTVQIPAPGLLVTYAAGTAVLFLGNQESTMGAACPPNGQRAG